VTERSSVLPAPYDAVDATIVDVLRQEGRLSIPALAQRVGISRATAYSRFDRLVTDGVISGFHGAVDPAWRGLGVSAIVLVDAEQPSWDETLRRLRQTPGVEWVGLAAAAFDFVVLVRARDLAELRDVVLQELREIPALQNTRTAILLDSGGVLA
jgi:DNA-binding Lrp family transcriptional regulator